MATYPMFGSIDEQEQRKRANVALKKKELAMEHRKIYLQDSHKQATPVIGACMP